MVSHPSQVSPEMNERLQRSPLAGVRILDLSRLLPGPFATLVLADLGAQIDKIEDPGAGDYLRMMPPVVGDMGAAFQLLNRGKRSAVIDLKSPEGVATLRTLVPQYDVLIESFRPGVMARLGLGYESLAELHPGLIYCAITGYGQDGPLAHRAGHDLNYLARAGVLGLTGPAGGPPQVPGVQMADIGGGALFAVTGILAALHARQITGRGRFVDVSMCEGAMAFGTFGIAGAFGGDPYGAGEGPLSGGLAPFSCYLTRDGRSMALGALEPKFWMGFCASVGIEPAMDALMPGPHQAEWKAKLTEIFAGRSFAEWVEHAAKGDYCLEPVLLPAEVASCPQHRARKAVVDLPAVGGGTLPHLRTPTASPPTVNDAPSRGRDTEQVLIDAGLTTDRIAALRAGGAIG
jgi:crotonobetainyl-CoA:carnitine CoA-transferase CaiB-like acyl-CoA transferase